MADNVIISEASTGRTVAGDEVGGVLYQRIKPAVGADGTAVDVSDAAPMPAKLAPTTSGGLTIFKSIDLDETEEEVKATAGQVYEIIVANTNASARYLKFYNATAATVTVGTTVPVMTLYVPQGVHPPISIPAGIAFDTAITVAATTGVADNDTGAPGANEIILTVLYK